MHFSCLSVPLTALTDTFSALRHRSVRGAICWATSFLLAYSSGLSVERVYKLAFFVSVLFLLF